jgi:hypothetical protein
MSSRVEYRFRCKKKSSYVTINAGIVSLSRLRELILLQEHLMDQADMALVIKNAQTQKTYKDPTESIHRNTQVIVSRLPAAILQAAEKPAAPPDGDAKPEAAAPNPLPVIVGPRQTDETGKEQQQFFFGESNWPRSFAFRPTRGRVILPYGEVACFQRTDEPPLSEGRWTLDDLKRWLCPLCHRLLTSATQTPCCSVAYCDSCITEYLLSDEQQRCPKCRRNGISPLMLSEDVQLRDELREWQKYDPQKLKGSDEYARMAMSRQARPHDDMDDFIEDGFANGPQRRQRRFGRDDFPRLPPRFPPDDFARGPPRDDPRQFRERDLRDRMPRRDDRDDRMPPDDRPRRDDRPRTPRDGIRDPRDRREDLRDRREDPHDRREDPRDRREDPRDRREDPRDRREDPRDRREDPRDRREDPRERREESRDRRDDRRDDPRDRREDPRDRREGPRERRDDPRDRRDRDDRGDRERPGERRDRERERERARGQREEDRRDQDRERDRERERKGERDRRARDRAAEKRGFF